MRHTNGKTDRRTDRQADRQTDRQTDREKGEQVDRQRKNKQVNEQITADISLKLTPTSTGVPVAGVASVTVTYIGSVRILTRCTAITCVTRETFIDICNEVKSG